MMHKLLLTTHWTADEAETILSFIDELREVILAGYEVDVTEANYLKGENTDDKEQIKDSNNREAF